MRLLSYKTFKFVLQFYKFKNERISKLHYIWYVSIVDLVLQISFPYNINIYGEYNSTRKLYCSISNLNVKLYFNKTAPTILLFQIKNVQVYIQIYEIATLNLIEHIRLKKCQYYFYKKKHIT